MRSGSVAILESVEGEDFELVIAEVLLPRGIEGVAVAAVFCGRVAQHRHPGLDECDAAVALDFRVFVPHESAEDQQRFVARFAQDVLLGFAQEFFPARAVVAGELAQFLGAVAEFSGRVFPTRPAGAVFGEEEECVVRPFERRCDHGGTLMAFWEWAYKWTVGYTLPFWEVKPTGMFCSVFFRAVGVSPPRE